MQYTGNKQSSSILSLSLLNLCMCSDRDHSCDQEQNCALILVQHTELSHASLLKKMLNDQLKNWSELDRRLHFSYVGINLPTASFCSATKLFFIFKKNLTTFLSAPSNAGGGGHRKHHHNSHLTLSLEMHNVYLNLHTLQEGLDSPSPQTGQ